VPTLRQSLPSRAQRNARDGTVLRPTTPPPGEGARVRPAGPVSDTVGLEGGSCRLRVDLPRGRPRGAYDGMMVPRFMIPFGSKACLSVSSIGYDEPCSSRAHGARALPIP
jgi:hypothetical protein